MDILLLVAPAATSLGYEGKGDFVMDPDGRLERRGEREVAPLIYAGVAILKPALFADTPEAVLAQPPVRSRHRRRAPVGRVSTANGCTSARPTPSPGRKRASRPCCRQPAGPESSHMGLGRSGDRPCGTSAGGTIHGGREIL